MPKVPGEVAECSSRGTLLGHRAGLGSSRYTGAHVLGPVLSTASSSGFRGEKDHEMLWEKQKQCSHVYIFVYSNEDLIKLLCW